MAGKRCIGMGCLKRLVLLFNLLLFLSGCAILALGIILRMKEGRFFPLAPDLPLIRNAANICIAAGFIVILMPSVGCCGAYKESTCLLKMFFLFLLLIFLLEVVAVILAFVYRRQVETVVTDDLMIKGLKNYGKDGEAWLTFAWDRLQTESECCGVNGLRDWADNNDDFILNQTPDSCCSSYTEGCGISNVIEKFQEGCQKALIKQLGDSIYYIVAGCIASGVCQILGMVFTMMLYYDIKRETRSYGEWA
ncbi:tetraspanin-9-like [Patiria miniata]|uniref:Tetraspanin n=1 Tax=Patiria miniata TaxID=46514 RepID=A0A914A602_PATMI|nr:tetraspanin-9-like [Patiria miniata]